jgi:hypothetical protein
MPRLLAVFTLCLLCFALTLLSISDHTSIHAQDARPATVPASVTWGAKEGELCLGCHTALNAAFTQEMAHQRSWPEGRELF